MAEIELRLNSPANQSSADELLSENRLKLEVEGECKIVSTQILEISYLRILLLTIPIIVSVFGLFLLKYYKSLRVKAFYWKDGQLTPTHLYVRGNGIDEE